MFRPTYCLLFLALLSSCSNSSIIKAGKVEFKEPGKVIEVELDSTFNSDVLGVQACFDLQIVSDTVLVIQVNPTDSLYFFEAWSTRGFDKLGSFGRKGRGPGELLTTRICKTESRSKDLIIENPSSESTCSVDVLESIHNSTIIAVDSCSFDRALYSAPLSDNCRFTIEMEDDILAAYSYDDISRREIEFFQTVDANRYITHLSVLLSSNSARAKVALAMLLFPQIAVIDVHSGNVKNIAVDRAFKDWKNVLASMLGPNSVEYYSGLCTSENYIFATYSGVSIKDRTNGAENSMVHIFDWDGNFLFAVKVKESLGHVTYDSLSKYLYAVDSSNDRIVRYDLSGCLLD